MVLCIFLGSWIMQVMGFFDAAKILDWVFCPVGLGALGKEGDRHETSRGLQIQALFGLPQLPPPSEADAGGAENSLAPPDEILDIGAYR